MLRGDLSMLQGNLSLLCHAPLGLVFQVRVAHPQLTLVVIEIPSFQDEPSVIFRAFRGKNPLFHHEGHEEPRRIFDCYGFARVKNGSLGLEVV
jgi:hypothetical protein